MVRGNNQNIFINGYVGNATEAYSMVTKISKINGRIEWMKNDTLSPYITGYYKIATLNNKDKVVALMTPLSGINYYLSFREQSSGNLIGVKQVPNMASITSYGDSLIGISKGNGASLFIFDEYGNQTRTLSVINSGETIKRVIPKIVGNTLWILGTNYLNGNKGFVQKMNLLTGQIYWRVNFSNVIDARGEIDSLGNSYYAYMRDTNAARPFQIVKLDTSGNILWNKEHFPNRSYDANQENFPHSVSVNLQENKVILGASVERDSILNTPETAGYIYAMNLSNGDSIKGFKIIEDSNSKLCTVEATTYDEYGDLYVLGKCYYQGPTPSWGWVKKYDSLLTEITIPQTQIAPQFELSQNYPNPFNPTTNIKFQVPASKLVTLKVYDVLGKEVATLVNEKLNAGRYEVDWNASGYPSGVYFYKLQAGDFTDEKKMLHIK